MIWEKKKKDIWWEWLRHTWEYSRLSMEQIKSRVQSRHTQPHTHTQKKQRKKACAKTIMYVLVFSLRYFLFLSTLFCCVLGWLFVGRVCGARGPLLFMPPIACSYITAHTPVGTHKQKAPVLHTRFFYLHVNRHTHMTEKEKKTNKHTNRQTGDIYSLKPHSDKKTQTDKKRHAQKHLWHAAHTKKVSPIGTEKTGGEQGKIRKRGLLHLSSSLPQFLPHFLPLFPFLVPCSPRTVFLKCACVCEGAPLLRWFRRFMC